MPIFKVDSGKLAKLDSVSLDKEKNLQKLMEDNLMEVLELRFLASEYQTTFGGRIDTLAVDANGAPVIIEYKRNRNDNVINQALSYLKWLKAQKSEFFQMLLINKLGMEVAQKIKLDWQNPRVICVAEAYSKFDIDTVEVVPLRIELYKYRFYEESIFVLEPLNVAESVSDASSVINKAESKDIDSTTSAAMSPLSKASNATLELFESFKERILSLDEAIEEKTTSYYVAYRVSKNFAEVHVGKNQIKIHLRPIDYDDPSNRVEKIPDGYNWTLDRRIYLSSHEELDYVMQIVEQSYKNIL